MTWKQIHICMYAVTNAEKKTMNSKERREQYIVGFGEKKEKEEI